MARFGSDARRSVVRRARADAARRGLPAGGCRRAVDAKVRCMGDGTVRAPGDTDAGHQGGVSLDGDSWLTAPGDGGASATTSTGAVAASTISPKSSHTASGRTRKEVMTASHRWSCWSPCWDEDR